MPDFAPDGQPYLFLLADTIQCFGHHGADCDGQGRGQQRRASTTYGWRAGLHCPRCIINKLTQPDLFRCGE